MSNCPSLRLLTRLFVAATLTAGVGQSQSVQWNAPGLPANSFELVNNQTVSTATNTCDGSTVTATWTDTDGVALAGQPFPGSFQADTANSIAYAFVDGAGAINQGIDLSLDFGGATGNAVENLAFSVFDIDSNSWTDRLTVTATYVGGIAVTLSCGNGNAGPNCTGFTIAGNVATGAASTSFQSPDGRVDVLIPGPVKTVNVRYEDGSGQAASQVFGVGGFNYTCSTMPVTMALFDSAETADGVTARWSTATETSNVGFYLYGKVDGGWQRLHDELIPSHQLDSLSPQHYRWPSSGARARTFDEIALAEVDLRGREKLHGPYEVGRAYGERPQPKRVVWEEVALENGRSQSRSALAMQRNGELSTSRVELVVEEDGIYRVHYDELAAAGVDFDGTPINDLSLRVANKKVPLRVVTADDSDLFGPGGYVEFIGVGLETLYSRSNVYRLAAKRDSAWPLKERGLAPLGERNASYLESSVVENERLYSFSAPNGDPWYDQALLTYKKSKSWDFAVEVEDLLPSTGGLLDLGVWGVTNWSGSDPDHHLVASVNGVVVGDSYFDGLVDASMKLEIPAGVLVEGENTVTVEMPGDTGFAFDLVHLDRYGIHYERRFSARDDRLGFKAQGAAYTVSGLSSSRVTAYMTTGRSVVRLTDLEVTQGTDGAFDVTFGGRGHREASYWVAAEDALLSPAEIRPARAAKRLLAGSADYLIVSHGSFLEALEPFVAAKQQDGWTVKVVDVADLYAKYSGGVFEPKAIRRYFKRAVPKLGVEHILLVGADSYDYFDHLGLGSISFVPTLYARTHSVVRYAPSDPLLTDLDGDRVPDVSIGRFPVRTLAELDLVIRKTLDYSARTQTADIVFAADRQDGYYSFTDVSEEWISLLPSGWSVERAFVDESDLDSAREVLLSELDRGVAVTNYFGHSGPTQWSFEDLFSNDDVAGLENASRTTIALQWGCWNGYHSMPEFDTVSHRLLVDGEQGAALAFGAATLTEAYSDRLMGKSVLAAATEPGTTFGAAVQAARAELGAAYPDVVLGMTLLGDPSLQLVD